MRAYSRFPVLALEIVAAALLAVVPFGRSVLADDQTVAWAQPTSSSVTISPGDTVTWQWGDSLPHTVTSTGGPESFDSGQLTGSGQTFAMTFSQAGTYTYQCNVHPATMSGTVVVQAAPAATATVASGTPAAPTTGTGTADGGDNMAWLLLAAGLAVTFCAGAAFALTNRTR